jgi:hypothetical protein
VSAEFLVGGVAVAGAPEDDEDHGFRPLIGSHKTSLYHLAITGQFL